MTQTSAHDHGVARGFSSFELPLSAGPFRIQRGVRATDTGSTDKKGRRVVPRYNWSWIDAVEETPNEGWPAYLAYGFGAGSYRIWASGATKPSHMIVDEKMAARLMARMEKSPPGSPLLRAVGNGHKGANPPDQRLEQAYRELWGRCDDLVATLGELEARIAELEAGAAEADEDDDDDDEPTRAENPIDIDAMVEAKVKAELASIAGKAPSFDINGALKIAGEMYMAQQAQAAQAARAANPAPAQSADMPENVEMVHTADAELLRRWAPLLMLAERHQVTPETAQGFLARGLGQAAAAAAASARDDDAQGT